MKIDHFYITDNNSQPPLSSVIQDYIDQGLVSYRYDTRHGPQIAVYNETIQQSRNQTQWLGIIDSDEFLVLKKHKILGDFLKEFEEFGAVSVGWYLFGSNGHIKRQTSGYAPYTKRFPHSSHYKTIVQPARVLNFRIHEVVQHVPGYYTVDEQKHPVSGPYTIHQETEYIQLNHYVIRSLEEFVDKCHRGAGDGMHKPLDFIDIVDSQATVEDYTLINNVRTLGLPVPAIDPDYEHLPPPDFSYEAYLIRNPDLHIFKYHVQAILHWVNSGYRENRVYKWDDGKDHWVDYLNRYPDLQPGGIRTQQDAVRHFMDFGKREGRTF